MYFEIVYNEYVTTTFLPCLQIALFFAVGRLHRGTLPAGTGESHQGAVGPRYQPEARRVRSWRIHVRQGDPEQLNSRSLGCDT